ncbi:MAG: hypothetical protein Q9164_002024 [Protoblastenia rupestris]
MEQGVFGNRAGAGLFGNTGELHYQSRSNGGFIDSNTHNIVSAPPETVLQHRHAASRSNFNPDDPEEETQFSMVDQETIILDLPSLATQESSWSESGMTATYDIPGLRTITPSQTTRRHRIASIHLNDVHLSYILSPKFRPVAFLKSRIRNTSSVAPLRGPTGLTLDGSFLGNTSLPRCSAGESFNLSLSVDPGISVTYSKPVVRRSQSNIINKEGSGIYTRTFTVTNTKSNRAIEGLALEQVPVSEDERLKFEILQPRGLRYEGDSVRAGTGINGAVKEDAKWGRATAVLKKGGEIGWDFKIEPGKGGEVCIGV